MAQYPTRFDNGIIVYGLPTNPALGAIAVDSADGNLKKYNGATWDIVGASIASPLGINQDTLNTTSFDVNVLGDFTQTGLALSTANPIKGTKSALLTHQAAINQSFKQIIAMDRKFRSKNLTLALTNRSTAHPSNLTLTITDETNATVISSSQIFTDKIPFIANTASSTTISAIPSTVINYLVAGQSITGAGIPVNTLIVSVNTSAFTMVISNAATATATGASLNTSGLPSLRTFPFDVPATCASLSYTVTALPEANLAESYIDDIVIALTSTIVLPVSTIQSVPSLKYTSATGQSVANTANNPLLFGTMVYDNTGSFNPATGIWTCTLPGLYCVSAIAGLTAAGTGVRWLDLYKNGGNDSRLGTGIASDYTVGGTSMVSLVAGDTIFISMYQNNGTAINLHASAIYTQLSIYRVSASTINTAQYFSQAALVQTPDSFLRLSGGACTGGSIVVYTTIQENVGSAFKVELATGKVTVQLDGIYHIYVGGSQTPSGGPMIYINGAQYGGYAFTSTASINIPETLPANLKVGDVITTYNASNGTLSATFLHIAYQGSLKQVQPQLNNKITIPTHTLRFEGASARGSTDTAIVKFDTQAITVGDGLSVSSEAVHGTVITVKKAGKLSITGSVYQTVVGSYAIVSKNQTSSLITGNYPTTAETVAMFWVNSVATIASLATTIDVAVGDVLRVVLPNGNPAANTPANFISFSLQEQSLSLAISNIWQQNGAGFNPDNLLLQQFDTAVLGDFTQTGLNFVIANALNGAKSAQLIHQASVNQSFKQTFQVSPKFRGKNLTLKHDIVSTATSGNVTLTVVDETNAVTLVNASSVPTNSQSVTATVTNTSAILTAVSNAIINGLSVGMRVTGTNIPSNTYITALDAAAGTITLSQAATGAGTAVRISGVVSIQKVSFDVPANCGSLSYLFTALPETGAESYFDGVSVDITSQSLVSTSITVPTISEHETIVLRTGAPFANTAGVDTLIPFAVAEAAIGSYALTSSAITIQKAGKYKITIKGETGANGESVVYKVKSNGVDLYTQATAHIVDGNAAGSNSHFSDTFIATLAIGNVINAYINNPNARTNRLFELHLELQPVVGSATTAIPLTTAQLVQTPDSALRIGGFTTTNASSATKIFSLLSGTIIQNIGSSIQYLDDSVNGARFVAQTSGIFDISFSSDVNSASVSNMGFSLNSNNLTTDFASLPVSEKITAGYDNGAGAIATMFASTYLNVGDIVRIHGGTASGGGASYSALSITQQGSLKQLNPSSNSLITIPTHQLRFEGASTRGSTDTVVIKFDAQVITSGDAWSVMNTAANGTVITMKKAGLLSTSGSLYTTAAGRTFAITKNQSGSPLIGFPANANEIVTMMFNPAASNQVSLASFVPVNVGDVIRVISDQATTATIQNNFALSLTETSIPANFSTVLPQWSESDSAIRLDVGNGVGSTNTQVRRFANNPDNLGTSLSYSDSASLGASVTINETGTYIFEYCDTATVGGFLSIYIIKNQTTNAAGSNVLAVATIAAGIAASTSGSAYLQKGDVVRAIVNSTANLDSASVNAKFSISKIGKPNATADVTPFVNLKLPDTNIVGEVVAYAGASVPENFLECDGRAVPRTGLYQDLFNVIGVTHGSGDGSTTFNIPDYRGRFLRGVDGAAARDPNSATRTAMNTGGNTGNNVGSVQTDATKKNGLALSDPGHTHTTQTNLAWTASGWGSGAGNVVVVSTGTGSSTTGVTLGAGDSETRPINAYVKYIIRYLANQTGLVTPTQQVSSDTMNFVFKATAIDTAVDPIGTYNTITVAANTNTETLAATAPTQTAASMNANGFLITGRAWNAASTAATPSKVVIYVGKGLANDKVRMYGGAAKTFAAPYDYSVINSTTEYGTQVFYNEVTGMLVLDASIAALSSNTTRLVGTTGYAGGYFVFNASKVPALVSLEKKAVIARVGASTSSAAQNTWNNPLIFTTKLIDNTNSYNTTTGVFTCPQDGKYRVTINARSASMVIINIAQSININLLVNGVIQSSFLHIAQTTTATMKNLSGSDIVQCFKGNTISFQMDNGTGAGSGAFTLTNDTTNNFATFEWIAD